MSGGENVISFPSTGQFVVPAPIGLYAALVSAEAEIAGARIANMVATSNQPPTVMALRAIETPCSSLRWPAFRALVYPDR
jgi:hypothetical protein